MKTSSLSSALALASVTAISLAFSPMPASAQTNPNPNTDTSQNTKATDSTADQNNASTGSSASQPGTLDKTSSKDTTNSLDKNPSTAPTDSADTSGTKTPNSTPAAQDKSGRSSGLERTSDRDFILKAAQGGMTEVELGKLAQEKASSADVKQFGSHMVMDHSKANAELKAIANKEGVSVPGKLDAKHQAAVNRLQHLSGAAFDRAYVRAMVKDHEKDAAEFRQASITAQNPEVKSFAGDTLKVIESHLSDIKSIQSTMK